MQGSNLNGFIRNYISVTILVYFDDVTESNWKSVKLLGEKISAKDIKQKIIDEMNRYNEKLIGNTSNGT